MAAQSNTTKAITLVVAVLLVALLAVKTFWIGYYRIPQNGMYPGLPAGSALFAKKHPYRDASNVKRGDIVVFAHEENGQRYNYIWRVIALPGEKVQTFGESLLINGKPVERQRLRESDGKTVFREQINDVSYDIAIDPSTVVRPPDTSLTVPPDHFFMMGDNRLDARDSRYFGPIPFHSFIARKL